MPDRVCFMVNKLKKIYLALLVPPILGLLLACLVKETGYVSINLNISLDFITPFVFVLSVVSAVALPVFLRAFFAHRMRNHKTVPELTLMKFEQKLMTVALISPYLVLPAYLLDFPAFYFLSIVLMAFYAAYFFYPSEKRIQFDRRIYRVKQLNSTN